MNVSEIARANLQMFDGRMSGKNFVGKSYDSILKSAEVEDYKKHLAEKFCDRVTIGNKACAGGIIIAPNIFEEMLNDDATANYYESKIKNIFDNIRWQS